MNLNDKALPEELNKFLESLKTCLDGQKNSTQDKEMNKDVVKK